VSTLAVMDSSTGTDVSIAGISKQYASGVRALESIDLSVCSGEFVTLVGPSGCGKSTLLRIVAGLVDATAGRVSSSRPGNAAFVFQEPALLPWRTVQANAELLLELDHVAPAECRERASESLRLVGLAGFEDSYPHRLSGGMRMRLSLARSIALRPNLLLLDEPLAAVDELTREGLQDELLALWSAVGFTAMLVTHNVTEAVYLSNRVIVMSPRPGRIVSDIEVPFAFPRAAELRSTAAFAHLTGVVSAALRGAHA
jgi:NitT/TauT family transport system ATP-binding protein